MDVQVIKDCRYLHPNMHCGKKAVDAVDRVAQEVFPYFSIKKIIKVFGTLFNQYEFYNVVLKEFT